jgi:ATP-dependent RNA helicase DeaD
MAEPTAPLIWFHPKMRFAASHPALARALIAREYTEPTEVQSAVLAAANGGQDLLVSAQTGSGKTVAYGLALAPTLLGEAERFERAGKPMALIVAPTRELAQQVHRELSWLYEQTGARVICCVGGTDARFEQRTLSSGAHIVVGTPGRLRDHVERGNLDLAALRAVVLDEADEMLDLGFRDDLEFLLQTTPEERRTLLFSATIAPEIASLARRYQRHALRIDTLGRHAVHADIEYRAIRMAAHETESALVNVLRHEDSRAAIVFAGTREAVRRLHANLENRGFSAVALSGELSQAERTHALQALRDGRARVCVATDVAARGLDLPDLGLVIHADLPTDKETLLHRSGRTGRAGRKGVSVLLVPHPKRRRAEMLIRLAGVFCTWSPPPSAADIRARDQERMLSDPLITEKASGEDAELARRLLEGRSAEDVAASLIRLYRARLPAPAEGFDAPPSFEPRREFQERDPRGAALRGADHQGERKPPAARAANFTDSTWFRISVGRYQNADPKWLLPLLCRVGEITRAEIGAIRVFDRETRFEIAAAAAQRFAATVEQADQTEYHIGPADETAQPRNFTPRPDGPKRSPFHKPGGAPNGAPGGKGPRKPKQRYAG